FLPSQIRDEEQGEYLSRNFNIKSWAVNANLFHILSLCSKKLEQTITLCWVWSACEGYGVLAQAVLIHSLEVHACPCVYLCVVEGKFPINGSVRLDNSVSELQLCICKVNEVASGYDEIEV